jgi:hypothetical protein
MIFQYFLSLSSSSVVFGRVLGRFLQEKNDRS